MWWTGWSGSPGRPAWTRGCSRWPTSSPAAASAWPHWTSSATATPPTWSGGRGHAAPLQPSGRGWDAVDDDPVLAGRWRDLEDLPRGTLVVGWPTSTGPGASPTRARPSRPHPSWPSTTGSTCWPTTAPPSSPSWRSSPSSPGPTTTCGPSRCWPWWCPCSRPAYLPSGAGLLRGRRRPSLPGRRGHPAGRRHAPGGPVHRQYRLPPHRLVCLRRPIRWIRCGSTSGWRPKAPEAVEQGSVGPWEPGGISPFQWEAGQALARRPRDGLRRLRGQLLGPVTGPAQWGGLEGAVGAPVGDPAPDGAATGPGSGCRRRPGRPRPRTSVPAMTTARLESVGQGRRVQIG